MVPPNLGKGWNALESIVIVLCSLKSQQRLGSRLRTSVCDGHTVGPSVECLSAGAMELVSRHPQLGSSD